MPDAVRKSAEYSLWDGLKSQFCGAPLCARERPL